MHWVNSVSLTKFLYKDLLHLRNISVKSALIKSKRKVVQKC